MKQAFPASALILAIVGQLLIVRMSESRRHWPIGMWRTVGSLGRLSDFYLMPGFATNDWLLLGSIDRNLLTNLE